MKSPLKWLLKPGIFCLAASLVSVAGVGSVYADEKSNRSRDRSPAMSHSRDHRDHDRDRRDRRDRDDRHRSDRHHDRHYSHRDYVIHRGHGYVIPDRRVRRYRNVIIYRPYGRWYGGYGHIHLDNDAFKWLAFTAITLKILDNLNEQQQREHEAAQVRATTAPLGERIIWSNGNATGSVTAIREGTSTAGRYCREFVQEVRIGGKTEQAYGTACRNQDGSWEVVSTGDSK